VSVLYQFQSSDLSSLTAPEKPTSFDLSVFQLNPPLRVGEIVFDDEIPSGDEIRLDGEWVDLISHFALADTSLKP